MLSCTSMVYGYKILIKRFWRDERGASLIEYALLIGLVTLMALGFIIAVGSWVNGIWGGFLR